MADGDYPGTMSGYPGQPQPGYAPAPSAFGYTMGAFGGPPLGFGGPSQPQMYQAGGMAAGLGVMNYGANALPSTLAFGATAAGMAGGFLSLGGASRGMRGLGTAMNFLDPLSFPVEMGFRGAGIGWNAGQAAGAARGFGMLGQGMMGGLYGAGSAAASFALPAAVAYGGYKAAQFATSNMWQGAQNLAMGQGLANQIGGYVSPQQNMAGQGAGMANMLREVSFDTKVDTEDLGRLAKEFTAQKLFQTTRDMKEFKEKFASTMKAVKEIAQITQGTIDEAAKMFGDLRQQGFYQTADIKAQATLISARAAASGLSEDTMMAIGGAGSQMARGMGYRGKTGSDLATRNAQMMATAVRRGGAAFEEMVMENGGIEQVALQQTQSQMSYLGSARGRATIAALMGQGGAPDPTKLRNFLGGGMSLESLVTSAAESGIGTLTQAGRRESKEAMMKYAPMAMISMAASQQQQLFGEGSVNQESIVRMLGTMGQSREQAAMMMASVQNLPEQIRQDRIGQQNAANQLAGDAQARRQSVRGKLDRQLRPWSESFQDAGASVVQDVSGAYTRTMGAYFGGREYRGGDDELVKEGFARLRGGGAGPGRSGFATETWFGNSADQDIRENYYGYAQNAGRVMGGRSGTLEDAISRGEVQDVGRQGWLGRRKYVDRGILEGVARARQRGLDAEGFSEGAQSTLDMLGGDNTLFSQMKAARSDNVGFGSQARRSILGMADAYGVAGGRYQEYRAAEQNSDTFFLAKKAGILSDGATYEQYISNELRQKDGQVIDQNAREALKGQMATWAGKVGGSVGQAFQDVRAGGTGAMDIENLRKSSGAKTNEFLMKFGSRGMFGGMSVKAADLGATLESDGKARKAFVTFTDAISKLDKNDPKSKRDFAAAKDKAVEAVGGADSNPGKEILNMYARAINEPGYAVDMGFETKGLREEYQNRAMGEALVEHTAATEKVVEDIDEGRLQASDQVKDLLGKMVSSTRAGRADQRVKQADRLLLEMMTDQSPGGAKIDDSELEVLQRVGIGGGGGKVGLALNAGLEGNVSKIENLLGEKLTDEEKAAVASKDPRKILEMMTKRGSGLDEMGASTEGAISREGTQQDYVEANTKFITAVDSFMSKWSDTLGLKPSEGKTSTPGASTTEDKKPNLWGPFR